MLSRIAESLFWIGRYVERADGVARILDVHLERITQLPVGEQEADLERGLLNVRSPLARALIGKDEGDSVEVTTPGGQKSYEILSIRYE